ncbi:M35 family metallo-endopeptidase [Burkholderia ambifaria]|uniref:M35 family metallo-endopeptidase n=1 Tax=Burkholderia ambifaria TaxID=152480 RepID=UPI00158BBDF2|nr:M35 family metallo-endopeptidase [Burkholderia ambifaria]
MPTPDDDYVLVHDTATTNTTSGSKVYVDINTTRICANMSNEQFAETVMRARDAAVVLIEDRIVAVARWDANEQARATTYFGRADERIRSALSSGLPRLLSAMRELVPEKIVRWDSELNKDLTCALVPDGGGNHAAVCKPDSHKRVIAIYSKFCSDSFGELYHASKIKVLIHECTHYTDTFDSNDLMYGDTETGMKIFAMQNPDRAIRNADSITGYIATFDDTII